MNHRNKRLFTGFLLPLAFGVILFWLYSYFISKGGNYLPLTAYDFFAVLIYVILLTGVQCVIYSFVMEYFINPQIKGHFTSIILSSVLGGISTLLPALVTYKHFIFFVILGMIIGVLTGVILRFMYITERKIKI